MDLVTHVLSGLAVASMMPNLSFEEKALIVAGTIIPDLPFGQAYFIIAKKAKKALWKLRLVDFTKFGPQVKPKLYTYLVFHSFLFIAALAIVEFLSTGTILLAIGWTCHLLYDLPAHSYKEEELRPKPLFPFDISWNWGITNGWKVKPQMYIVIWSIHILLIFFITRT